MMNSDNLTTEQWQMMLDNRDLIEPIVRKQCRGHNTAAWSAGQDGLVDAAAQYIAAKGHFKRYARRIIRRRVIVFLKDKQKHNGVVVDAAGELPQFIVHPGDLEDMIKPLAPLTQQAMRLRYEDDGMTLKEIGEQMDCHLSTVHRIIARGIKQLKQIARNTTSN